MKTFKNVITSNIVTAKNEIAVSLMEKSENYVAVKDSKKGEKKPDNKAE